jgi:hypothetical protein
MRSQVTTGSKWLERGGSGIVAEVVGNQDGKVQLAVKGREGYRIMSVGSLFSNYKPAPVLTAEELAAEVKAKAEAEDNNPEHMRLRRSAKPGKNGAFGITVEIKPATKSFSLGVNTWLSRPIVAFDAATDKITVSPAFPAAVGVADEFVIENMKQGESRTVAVLGGDTGKPARAAVGRVKLQDGKIIAGSDFITQVCGCIRAETYNVDSPIRWLLKPAGQDMLKVRGATIVYGEKVTK